VAHDLLPDARGLTNDACRDGIARGRTMVGIVNVSTYHASDAFRSAVLTHGDPDLLQAMVDGSPDGLCLLSPNRALLIANRAAHDLLGQHLDPESPTDPHCARACAHFDWSIVDQAAQRRQAIDRVDTLDDGRRLLVTARPTVSPGGTVSFVVLTLRDLASIGSALPAPWPASPEANGAASGPGSSRDEKPTELIARSPAMAAARNKAWQYALVDSPVLLLGERGTGKRILARAIHEASGRRDGPFMEAGGALPEALLDAELFGQAGSPRPEEGASPRVGLFELAHRGTVLLTEVGDLPPALQIKLLRFMDDGEVWPVGAAEPRRPDVRLLVSSGDDLGQMVADGRFRADLYYRLNVLTLTVPPLRDRGEDIRPLVEMMVAYLARTARGRARMPTPAAMAAIARCSFPGNVRELWDVVDRLVVGTGPDVINTHDLPPAIGQDAALVAEGGRRLSMRKTLKELEAQMVRDALTRYGTQTEAAKYLGVTQSTVARKAKQYGLGRR
jgi:transcriptional regulator with PAS, ATPase and Fis domain